MSKQHNARCDQLIKVAAHAHDIPYQALLKVWWQEKVHKR